MKSIIVKDFIGNNFAVSASDGTKLFEKIVEVFNSKDTITLDFEGIDLTISAFLNTSIGQLYSKYSSEFIRENLSVINLAADEAQILSIVIAQAKNQFANSQPNTDLIND